MNIVPIQKDETLVKNIAKLYCMVYEGKDFDEMVERITRHMDYKKFKGIVAISDAKEIIGFAYGYQSLEGQYYNHVLREALSSEQANQWLQDCFEFVELAVHSNYRKNGLGTVLHNHLLDGIFNKTSVLTTQVSNHNARSLYEKLEWINIMEPFHPSKDDVPYVIMGKDLSTI
ncbi:GNAT family N-acetyltransferase [Bacillus bingmayongensis]|uniref:GNAT family N-acetyltransferase n=1 Tax=Bacillus bingmayongensis TaxID=1150157 RepID=UPI0002F324D7|nr:GNAT family N-acetyltransferase [Bacillus bingmayongensis]MBY0599289.1 GNAT family N-acetyltransferase [Bacillus bingmayongensis]